MLLVDAMPPNAAPTPVFQGSDSHVQRSTFTFVISISATPAPAFYPIATVVRRSCEPPAQGASPVTETKQWEDDPSVMGREPLAQ